MPYRSPVLLISYVGENLSAFSYSSIANGRKILLAELAQKGDPIYIDSVSFTRNDVLTALGSIRDEAEWQQHSKIFSSAPLLQFLQTGVFDAAGFAKDDLLPVLQNDTGFIQFVSPWAAKAFQQASLQLLQAADWYGTTMLYQKGVSMLVPGDFPVAFSKTKEWLSSFTQSVAAIKWDDLQNDETILYFLFDVQWLQMINSLPAELGQQRSILADKLIALMVSFQFKATWGYLEEASAIIAQINSTNEVKVKTNTVKGIMSKNAQLVGRNSNARKKEDTNVLRKYWWVSLVILWGIRALFIWDKHSKETKTESPIVEPYSYNPGSGTSSSLEETAHSRDAWSAQNLIDYNNSYQANVLAFLQQMSTIPDSLVTDDTPFPYQTGDVVFSRNNSVMRGFAVLNSRVKLRVVNNSGYNCILLYFNADDKRLSYRNDDGMGMSVFIGKKDMVEIEINPEEKGFYNFYFGKDVVNLTPALKFETYDLATKEAPAVSFQHYIFNAFKPVPGLQQKLLRHATRLSYQLNEKMSSEEKVVFKPSPGTLEDLKKLKLQHQMNILINADKNGPELDPSGTLFVTQEKLF